MIRTYASAGLIISSGVARSFRIAGIKSKINTVSTTAPASVSNTVPATMRRIRL